MLDKCLCDLACWCSKVNNNLPVTVYQWQGLEPVYIVNDARILEIGDNIFLQLGDPIAWGFSHK